MGRIVAFVKIESVTDPAKRLRCDALVDTDASHLVLPTAWKDRLPGLELVGTVKVETATPATVQGEVYGPVKIQIEGFRPIFGEVLFGR
jgi:hypothetical protein